MKAFIYDMDGVICDTEPVHIEAEQRVLKKLGITVPDGYTAYEADSSDSE